MRNARNWYLYCLLVFLVNVIAVILTYFVVGMKIAAPFLFFAVLFGFASAILLHRKEDTHIGDAIAESNKWCLLLAAIAILYAIIVGIRCAFLLRNGSSCIENGLYYLTYRGKLIRQITAEEYRSLSLVEGRLFLSGLLPFTAFALVFHSGRKNMYTF